MEGGNGWGMSRVVMAVNTKMIFKNIKNTVQYIKFCAVGDTKMHTSYVSHM